MLKDKNACLTLYIYIIIPIAEVIEISGRPSFLD